MQDENLPDQLPVCQDLRARVESDPVLAAQWRGLVADVREAFAAHLSRRRAASLSAGCVEHGDSPPGASTQAHAGT